MLAICCYQRIALMLKFLKPFAAIVSANTEGVLHYRNNKGISHYNVCIKEQPVSLVM